MLVAVLNPGSATAKAVLVELSGAAARIAWRRSRGLGPGGGAASANKPLVAATTRPTKYSQNPN